MDSSRLIEFSSIPAPKFPRPASVKNKSAAPVQMTSEQILLHEAEIRAPKQMITDASELDDYRLRKRKEFEDQIRRGRQDITVWVKYAQWEDSQKDLVRARSVWERALEVDYRNHLLWLMYADFEMKNKCVDHARNVWDRAVSLLPHVDQLWHKYVHMEEILGNVAGARLIFERWMSSMPGQQGWRSYIKFELRHNEIKRARGIYERLVACHPKELSAWIRFAKFEFKNGKIDRCRNVYDRAFGTLLEVEAVQSFIAAFEEIHNQIGHAGPTLDHIPKQSTEDLYGAFVAFEKQYGDEVGIEDAVVGKRRCQYEDEVRKNPLNYDAWFDYIRLERSVGDKKRVREVYERCIANQPPSQGKIYWQSYIDLWIYYALYEELVAEDVERTRAVYGLCLQQIRHGKFSSSKIWLLAAQFEVRQLNLKGARQILEDAVREAPKDKVFKKYIEIELQLGNIDACREIYKKYVVWSPQNCKAWIKFAELERSAGETEIARAIFEQAIARPAMDMPDLLWKAYVDFEISEGETERTRQLYERLLDRSKNLKVWISYAKFEAGVSEENKSLCIENARSK
ncbi:Crooked neck-like protein 1 [Linum grandiflorum]